MVERISQNRIGVYNYNYTQSNQTSAKANTTNKSTDNSGVILELGNQPQKAVTYQRPVASINPSEVSSKVQVNDQSTVSSYRSIVSSQMQDQALRTIEYFKNLKSGETAEVDEETKVKASQSVAEGGEFSVENTAQRLFDFAAALSGGDNNKMAMLQDSIKQAFKEVEEMLGGSLPTISYQTFDTTMKKFDEYFKK